MESSVRSAQLQAARTMPAETVLIGSCPRPACLPQSTCKTRVTRPCLLVDVGRWCMHAQGNNGLMTLGQAQQGLVVLPCCSVKLDSDRQDLKLEAGDSLGPNRHRCMLLRPKARTTCGVQMAQGQLPRPRPFSGPPGQPPACEAPLAPSWCARLLRGLAEGAHLRAWGAGLGAKLPESTSKVSQIIFTC